MKKENYLHLLTIMMVAMLSVGFASCGGDDDDDSIDTSPITLYAGDETSVNGASSIESENEFVVYIGKSDNSVNGFHVGNTFIKVNGKNRIPVTVKGKYHTYDDPVTEWGCSQDYVKSHQKQGTLNTSKSDSKSLIYENVGHADILMYNFENGKLKSIAVLVSTAYTSEYAGYLAERFLMIKLDNSSVDYAGVDALDVDKAKTYVGLKIYSTSYLMGVYMPASDSKSSSAKISIENRLRSIKLQ